MPAFTYTAKAADGKTLTGNSEAATPAELRQRLTEQGYTVQKVAPAKATKKATKASNQPNFLDRFQKVKLSDLSIFCRQFSTMIDAGVSLVRCLDVLSDQSQSPKLRRIIADLRAEVEAGNMLSKAMAKYPSTFSNLFVGLIRAGEVGGVLEESLQRLSTFLEKDVELRRKVKSAMTYPILVSVVALGIVMFLTIYIVPQFLKMFIDLGLKAEDFPAMTMSLKIFSDFLVDKWYIMILSVVIFVIAFKMFTRTKFGRRVYDRFKLKVPVFGKLNHKVALARFSRTLSTLLTSGVPILQALETVAGTVSNEILSDAILDARARVREGDVISEPLRKSKMFPPMVVQMISIGQESGSLDTMLSKIADFYDGEVDAAIASLTAAIEPILIVFLGFTVGYIVIAMFLPLVGLIQGLSGDNGDGDK
ncbi:type II secretion system F family protein [Armatimonas rosea]|uniref:Type IV pilus assembly protein PilC n=1 Tax=Armatimonas rosea TaxID=685828 RepID=A0A7W9STW1_ARMRO|nr:type II secretion system F family protein [Armatimonas rosea]MBB6051884.1 type IV pilus assembly protein PilC [Armatimonas rosea]